MVLGEIIFPLGFSLDLLGSHILGNPVWIAGLGVEVDGIAVSTKEDMSLLRLCRVALHLWNSGFHEDMGAVLAGGDFVLCVGVR
jgi:hypothetical protein